MVQAEDRLYIFGIYVVTLVGQVDSTDQGLFGYDRKEDKWCWKSFHEMQKTRFVQSTQEVWTRRYSGHNEAFSGFDKLQLKRVEPSSKAKIQLMQFSLVVDWGEHENILLRPYYLKQDTGQQRNLNGWWWKSKKYWESCCRNWKHKGNIKSFWLSWSSEL